MGGVVGAGDMRAHDALGWICVVAKGAGVVGDVLVWIVLGAGILVSGVAGVVVVASLVECSGVGKVELPLVVALVLLVAFVIGSGLRVRGIGRG